MLNDFDSSARLYCNEKTPILLGRLQNSLGLLCLSAITLAELRHGVEKSLFPEKNTKALIDFLSIAEVLPFDDRAAEEYGKLKTVPQRRGTPIGPLDILIAAHAKASGAILVTNNKKEFARVDGLRLEDWTE